MKTYKRADQIQLTEKEGQALRRALWKVMESIYTREPRDIPRALLMERIKLETSYIVALARTRKTMKDVKIERIG